MDQVTYIFLFVLVFALLLPLIHRFLYRRPRVYRAARYFIFGVYVLANLYETILFREVQPVPTVKWMPLWSYRASLSVWDGLQITDLNILVDILLNILLYIPLGYLLPFLWPRLRPNKARPWPLGWVSGPIVLTGFLCSCATEISQLIFRIGWFEIDDIINNTLGCLIGCMLYEWVQRLYSRL